MINTIKNPHTSRGQINGKELGQENPLNWSLLIFIHSKTKEDYFFTGRSVMKLLSPVATAVSNINSQVLCIQYKFLCCPVVPWEIRWLISLARQWDYRKLCFLTVSYKFIKDALMKSLGWLVNYQSGSLLHLLLWYVYVGTGGYPVVLDSVSEKRNFVWSSARWSNLAGPWSWLCSLGLSTLSLFLRQWLTGVN